MSATPEGRNYLNTKFNLCKNLTKAEDQDELIGLFISTVFIFFFLIIFFFSHRISNRCLWKFSYGKLSIQYTFSSPLTCISG